jgi:hypothetical protein
MAAPSVTHTFTNGTTADATEVNQNFTDIINGITDGNSDLTISAFTANGAAVFNGTVTLGNATGDDVTITGRIAAHIDPKTASTYDLGDSTQLWRASYFDNHLASINAVGDPSYSFHADTNTGMYSAGADTLNFGTGGTLALTITSAQLCTFANAMIIADGSAAAPSIYSATGTSDTGIYMDTADEVDISCAGSDVANFSATGLVLTGTINVSGAIEIADGSTALPSIYSATGTSDTGISMGVADQVHISTGGVERVEFGTTTIFNDTGANVDFRIEGDTDANLFFLDASADTIGVGTSAPAHTLTVYNSTNPVIALQNATTGTGTNTGGTIQISSDDMYVFNYETAGQLFFGTNGATDMTIAANGDVSIQSFTGSGDVTSTAGKVLIDTSDMRLKTDDGPVHVGLAEILALEPRYYKWNSDIEKGLDVRQLGFFAQEVHAHIPEAAPYDEAEDKWGFSSRALVACLVNAVKELSKRLDDLEAK